MARCSLYEFGSETVGALKEGCFHAYSAGVGHSTDFKRNATVVGAVAKVPINDPKHWRERAEEARVHAEQMTDAKAKKMMLRIASDYEELARRAERRLKQATKDR